MTITTTLAFNQSNSNFSQLNPYTPLIKAYFQGRNDGLDQVYLKGNNGKHYVLEMDSNIDFYSPQEGMAKPEVNFIDGTETITATLEYYDNESHTSSVASRPLNAINPGLGDAVDHLLDAASGVISYDYNPDNSKLNNLKAEQIDSYTFEVSLGKK